MSPIAKFFGGRVSAGGFSRSILRNTAYLGGARIAQLLTSFTIGVSVARYLGPGDAGALAYAVSFVALFSSAAALGLDSIVIRDLAIQEPGGPASDEILSSAFVLRMLVSPAVFVITVCASFLADSDQQIHLLVAIVASGVIFQPLSVIDLYFQSQVRSKYVVYAQLAALAAVSCGRVILIISKAHLLAFAVVTAAESVIWMCGLVYVFSRHRNGKTRLRPSKAMSWTLLTQAWPLALTGILTSVYINVDRILIKHLLGNASAGKYAVVVNISTALYFIPIAFGQSVFPSLIESRRDPQLYHVRLQQAFDALLWLGIAIALPVCLIAEPLMRILYGPLYEGSGAALAIVIWSAVVTFLGLITSYWLVAENLQRIYPIRILGSLATCIVLDLLLIPRWGIRGAAVATVFSQFVASTVVYGFSKKTRIMVVMQLRALALPYRILAARRKR